MATVEVRDAQGGVVGERELPAELFEGEINVPVMHQVVVAGAAAQRAGTHSTKTRGDVRGGGRKPWRQKGTGRARQGSSRAPQWAGGGVVHGPKPRDYSMRINKKMRRAALRSALTDAAQSGKLAMVETLLFDGPRTKDAVGVLDALELEGRILLVIGEPDEAVEKSFRNLGRVRIAYPGNLATWEILYADRVLFTAAALDGLVERASERPLGEPGTDEGEAPAGEPGAEEAEEPSGDDSDTETEDAGGDSGEDLDAGATGGTDDGDDGHDGGGYEETEP